MTRGVQNALTHPITIPLIVILTGIGTIIGTTLAVDRTIWEMKVDIATAKSDIVSHDKRIGTLENKTAMIDLPFFSNSTTAGIDKITRN